MPDAYYSQFYSYDHCIGSFWEVPEESWADWGCRIVGLMALMTFLILLGIVVETYYFPAVIVSLTVWIRLQFVVIICFPSVLAAIGGRLPSNYLGCIVWPCQFISGAGFTPHCLKNLTWWPRSVDSDQNLYRFGLQKCFFLYFLYFVWNIIFGRPQWLWCLVGLWKQSRHPSTFLVGFCIRIGGGCR